MKPQTRLVLSDVHIPFQDNDLVGAWLDFAKALKPDAIDIIGDLLDCYPLSTFDKNPARRANIQDEADQGHDLLRTIRKVVGPKCQIKMTEGNHEHRLTRMLWGRSKELAPIRNLRIPALLRLDELGIQYHGPQNPYRVGNLWFLHGDVSRKQNFSKSAGGSASDAIARAVGGSVLIGHTHQMGHRMYRNWEKNLEGYEVGCVCQFDMEYVVGVPPWQQGWAVANIFPDGNFSVEFIRSVEGTRRKRHLVFRNQVVSVLPPAKVHHMETS